MTKQCAAALALPVVLLLSACAGEPEPVAIASPTPEATPAPVLTEGIDVSFHNGAVDWAAVREAGHTFGIVKASEGVDLPDPAYSEHWAGLTAAGLIRGAYHFYVTEDDPDEQAKLFLRTARLEPGDLVPVVDIELIGHHTAAGLAERLQRFLDLLEQHYGAPPIIYTSPNFADRNLGPAFARYPLWVAEYGVDEPRLPEGWSTWHLWQHTDDAEVPGVATHADLSRVNRELGSVEALLIPSSSTGV